MKNILILIVIVFSLTSAAQTKKKQPATILSGPSISNLKLGLNESYILEKYNSPGIDSVKNSTRILFYDKIKLDNNVQLERASFTFFKNKLFKIVFKSSTEIHSGLSAKYGYKELAYDLGCYGGYDKNIQFIKMKGEVQELIFILDLKTNDLSNSEGF